MDHVCDVCCLSVTVHETRCSVGEPDMIRHPAYTSEGGIEHRSSVDYNPSHYHLPALCCPGCACRSYEEAHPETIGTPVAEYARFMDRATMKALAFHQVLTMEELVAERYAVRYYRNIGPVRWRGVIQAKTAWEARHAEAVQ